MKTKRNTRNWKHTTHNHKAYGNYDSTKYESPFMTLDEEYLDDEEENEEV